MKVGVAFAQKKKPSSLKIQERITEGYVLLLLTLFLFAVPQEGYVNIISMKYGLFLCLCGGYVLISLVIQCEYLGLSGILAGVKKCTPKKLWKNYPLHSLIFAYLCFTTISALCSPYDGTFFGKFRQEGVLSLWIYGLCCGLVALYYRPKELHLWICGLSACLFCIFGWIQLLGGNPLTLFPEPYHYFHSNVFYSGTYWSTIGNVNLCAVVLCSWVAVFGVTLIRCTGKNIYLATIPLFLAVISAFALGSSSSILAIALGLLLLLPLTVENVKMFLRWFLVCGICGIGAGVGVVPHFSHPTIISMVLMISIFLIITYFTLMYSPLQKKLPLTHSFHKELYLLVAGFLILLLAILYFVPFSSGVLFQIHEILHGRGEDGFGTGRLFIWRGVWDLILENPWLGGGADTLGMRDLFFYSIKNGEIYLPSIVYIDVAHNEWLNIWVNQGIFALLAYLGIVVQTLISLWQNRQKFPVLLSGAVVIFYQIQGFFGISMILTAPYFWLAVGMANCYVNKTHKN